MISIAYLDVTNVAISSILKYSARRSLVWHKQFAVGLLTAIKYVITNALATDKCVQFRVILLMRIDAFPRLCSRGGGMTLGEASYLSNLGPSAVCPAQFLSEPLLAIRTFKASATELKVVGIDGRDAGYVNPEHCHRRGSQKTPRRATLVMVDIPAMGSLRTA